MSSRATSSFPLFHRTKIPPYYREPYISAGYRKPNSTVFEAVMYVFVLRNNDCLNFWTHFVPLLAWIAWFWRLSFKVDLSDPYFYPLTCLWFGCCTYTFCSSMAHMLGCMSLQVRQVCFLVDYMGISMYAFSGSLATFFYLYPADSLCFRYKWATLTLFGALCVGATALSGLSRFYWERWRFVIRAGAYALPYTTSSFPAWIRLLMCQFAGRDCTAETHNLHILAIVMIAVLAFFFVSKVPERFAPGRFDTIFQSHQLFHLCAAAASCLHLYTFPIDAAIRRELMSADVNRLPDFYSTILLYAVVNASCLAFVAALSFAVFKGILLSNKQNPPEEDAKDK